MVSKSKRIVALILTAMIAATAFAGCSGGGTTTSTTPAASTASTASTAESTASTAAGDESTTEQSATTPASDVSMIDFDNPDVVASIKDLMAEEAAATGGVISMTMWCSADDRGFEEALKKKFEEKYADDRYSFKIKPTPIGEDKAGGKIQEKPEDGADVFSFADDQLIPLVLAGALANVADMFSANIRADSDETALDICSSDGKIYAFPKTSDNGYFLYYDKTVLSEEDVQSMDTMIEKSAAANKSVFFPLTNPWYNTAFFFTAGCTITYKDYIQTATYGTDEGFNAVKSMCHIAEKVGNGFAGDPGSAGENTFIATGFKNGTLSAAVTGTWEAPAIKDAIGEENVGAAKLPTVWMNDEQKQLESFAGYKLIGVNAYTKYPTTAQALASFLSSAESQKLRYQNRGLIPTSLEALKDETIKNDVALQAIEAQKPFTHPQGQSVGGKYWGAGVGDYGGKILSVKGALKDDEIKEDLAKIEAKMQ